MDKRKLFGEDVVNYDEHRPLYHNSLFEDILDFIDYSNGNVISAIEIGCGTGQATTPFLKKGINVHAIEISKNMCDYVTEKYKDYKGFSVSNTEFEESIIINNSVDLLYSATAFHWINEGAYQKVFNIIKPNGTVALFWNYPFVSKNDDAVHVAIQEVYNKYSEKGYIQKTEKPKEDDYEKYNPIVEKLLDYGFIEFDSKKYKSIRELTAKEYLGLLNTYSDHRQMELSHRLAFESDIVEAINNNGKNVKIYDTTILYLLKKLGY